ncbi:hypothetical protein [Halorarum halobium]|uniref:hypothetical protein n=1 Tax=Halorarum halobium TaxID=3075121 RepID=UPI0028B017C0|nr:hypothetical protein [Halobaculum sp. XH14]
MHRRTFLKGALSAFAIPSLSLSVAAEPSTPSISQTDLSQYGWKVTDPTPTIPSFSDSGRKEDVQKTSWGLNAFHGTNLPGKIEEATPLEDVDPLKHIWTTHVTTTDEDTKQVWTGSESGEAAASIDGTTEAAFEKYVTESVLQGEMEFRGEFHRKAAKQGTTGLLGQIPTFGPLIAQLTSWVWDMKTSVTTATEDTAHISQYYFSVPLTAISSDAESKVDEEVSLDYRGIYIDWFTDDNEFYAAGGVYPQSMEHMNVRLSEAFDSGMVDIDLGIDPEIQMETSRGFEKEVLDLLRKVG